MDTVELPPEVFRELCQFVPWCRLEGDRLFASGAVPCSDTDSSENILGRILSEHGPVLHRREFWELAQGQGVEEVRFNQLLSGSNIIVRNGPGFYGLIGTPLNDEEVSALPEEKTESAAAVVVVPADGSGAISELNPGLAEFPEQLYRFVRKRQQLMAEQGSWSLAEIGLTAPDRFGYRRVGMPWPGRRTGCFLASMESGGHGLSCFLVGSNQNQRAGGGVMANDL